MTSAEIKAKITTIDKAIASPHTSAEFKDKLGAMKVELEKLDKQLTQVSQPVTANIKKTKPIVKHAKKQIQKKAMEVSSNVNSLLDSLRKEVKDFNAGRSEKELETDSHRLAELPGKRTSKSGKVYYEDRANRSDISAEDRLALGGRIKAKMIEEMEDEDDDENDQYFRSFDIDGPEEFGPNYDEDSFIDANNGSKYGVVFGGKYLGTAVEMEDALSMIKKAQDESPNYFPSLWFVSDHGNVWPIDMKGNEIKAAGGILNKDYTFKVANMKKEQEFTLYPYNGGDYIYLQSDKRFCRVNLRTGEGIINGKNENYANSIKMQMNPIPFTLPEDIKKEIQGFLWHNEGKQGNIKGVVFYNNKELFSDSSLEDGGSIEHTGKYRAEVVASGENRWSNNGMEYETKEEAEDWLKKLSGRWFGYDLSRVVTVDTPYNQPVDMEKDVLFQNYRKQYAGKGGRLKSALMRDRKYESQQEWEQSYQRKRGPRHPHYKADGGQVQQELSKEEFIKLTGWDFSEGNEFVSATVNYPDKATEFFPGESILLTTSNGDSILFKEGEDVDFTYKKVNPATIYKAKGGRLKSALMRDRKYTSREPWEQKYHRKTPYMYYKAKGGTVGKMRYDVLSPDGITIGHSDYASAAQRDKALKEWIDRFKSQGYYRDNKWNKIPLSELADHCELIEYEEMAKGGPVDNDFYASHTDAQLWNDWTAKQRRHFIKDHFPYWEKVSAHELLQNFNLGNLDELEQAQYELFSKHSTKQAALQILINSTEGDFSQLNEQLAEIAELELLEEKHIDAVIKLPFDKLEEPIQWAVEMHRKEGQYESGGPLNKGENIDVFGYQTKNFDICPDAALLFRTQMNTIDSNGDHSELLKANFLKHLAGSLDDVFGLQKQAYKGPHPFQKQDIERLTSAIIFSGIYNNRGGSPIPVNQLIAPALCDIVKFGC